MKDQRTGEALELPERARGLIVGRKEKEGVVVLMGGQRAFIFIHRIEGARVALRLVADEDIEFHRIIGRAPEAEPAKLRRTPEPDAPLTQQDLREEPDEPEKDARRSSAES